MRPQATAQCFQPADTSQQRRIGLMLKRSERIPWPGTVVALEESLFPKPVHLDAHRWRSALRKRHIWRSFWPTSDSRRWPTTPPGVTLRRDPRWLRIRSTSRWGCRWSGCRSYRITATTRSPAVPKPRHCETARLPGLRFQALQVAIGVARPSAQGQAISSTAKALSTPSSIPADQACQTKVARATTITPT